MGHGSTHRCFGAAAKCCQAQGSSDASERAGEENDVLHVSHHGKAPEAFAGDQREQE